MASHESRNDVAKQQFYGKLSDNQNSAAQKSVFLTDEQYKNLV